MRNGKDVLCSVFSRRGGGGGDGGWETEGVKGKEVLEKPIMKCARMEERLAVVSASSAAILDRTLNLSVGDRREIQ